MRPNQTCKLCTTKNKQNTKTINKMKDNLGENVCQMM